MESYKEKLRAFNNTPKYKSEVEFLKKLTKYDSVNNMLDIGCGLGHTAKELMADGYDVVNYLEADISCGSPIEINGIVYNNLNTYKYNHIYFMHSIAHIDNITEVLKQIKKDSKATVTVITPNAHWLIMQSNNEYKPDPTVVKHYTQTQLRELFEEAGYEVALYGQFGEESNGVNERLFLQAR